MSRIAEDVVTQSSVFENGHKQENYVVLLRKTNIKSLCYEDKSMTKVLFLCTGNSCRSQIAEGFLKHHQGFDVYSASTNPAGNVQPLTVGVMSEIGIDISDQESESAQKYLNDEFDYVITVCDGAKESCPIFTGKVKNKLHIGFEDPHGKSIEIYRQVRDEIKEKITDLVKMIRG